MSTRSAIIMKTDSGYAGIYCYFDGYKEGVGATLLTHYTDAGKVAALIQLGDISILGDVVSPAVGDVHTFDAPIKGVTVAYGRDRGETEIEPKVGKTVAEVSEQIGHNGYVYVFKNGQWTCNGRKFKTKIAA